MSLIISNVKASCDIGTPVDLLLLVSQLWNVVYTHNKGSSSRSGYLLMKDPRRGFTVQIFPKGTLSILGADSPQAARDALNFVVDQISQTETYRTLVSSTTQNFRIEFMRGDISFRGAEERKVMGLMRVEKVLKVDQWITWVGRGVTYVRYDPDLGSCIVMDVVLPPSRGALSYTARLRVSEKLSVQVVVQECSDCDAAIESLQKLVELLNAEVFSLCLL